MAQLTEQERQIIQLRFGFNPEDIFYTIDAVSKICEISRDKVRKLEFKALRRIKNLMGQNLKDYLTES